MHIANSANTTQLWTVIPYAVATPVTGKLSLDVGLYFSSINAIYSPRRIPLRSAQATRHPHACRPTHLHRWLRSNRQYHGCAPTLCHDVPDGHWPVLFRSMRAGLELK